MTELFFRFEKLADHLKRFDHSVLERYNFLFDFGELDIMQPNPHLLFFLRLWFFLYVSRPQILPFSHPTFYLWRLLNMLVFFCVFLNSLHSLEEFILVFLQENMKLIWIPQHMMMGNVVDKSFQLWHSSFN